jgi:hypothetical protein
MAQKGVRFIGGREFLLAGRTTNKESADRESSALRSGWSLSGSSSATTSITSIYVHGSLRVKPPYGHHEK